jgi:hypothetical protein
MDGSNTDSRSGEKKVAVLVVHGIGRQKPYSTLDTFTRNFVGAIRSFEGYSEFAKTAEHRIRTIIRANTKTSQSYISVTGDAENNIPTIDFYEFYWAQTMSGQSKMSEIAPWLDQISRSGAIKYRENSDSIRAAQVASKAGSNFIFGEIVNEKPAVTKDKNK